jgi:uncharacterized protein (TIGR02246 family)
MDKESLHQFAARYTAAWCSHDAARVASFFAPDGSLTINDGAPSVGREQITAAAQSFMTAFPDLSVVMDGLATGGERTKYFWTLTGTNTGPGGSGRRIRISGCESWRFTSAGLIAESDGQFDQAEYQKQLETDHTSAE